MKKRDIKDFAFNLPDNSPIIVASVANRKEAKIVMKQYHKILRILEGIEINFLNHVYDSPYDYKELYEHFEHEYRIAAGKLRANKKKYKNVFIRKEYFIQNYYPAEKESTVSIFSSLKKFIEKRFPHDDRFRPDKIFDSIEYNKANSEANSL